MDVRMVALGWTCLAVGACPACESAPGKAGVEVPAEWHKDKPHLPPPTLGLPPNPMTQTKVAAEAAHPRAERKDPPLDWLVPMPPITTEMWKCTSCHDDPADVKRERRELKEEHTNIHLQHGRRWCLDCHDADDRDALHLASGATVTFEESYKVCGECHGDKYSDWQAGIHGKRTGMWNGEKKQLVCVNCHNPHAPHFQPMQPAPPPVRPEQVR